MKNPQYAADFEALAAVCRERGVAVQTIKAITQAPWGEREQRHATWYAPLEDQADIDLAVHWVLGRADVFLNTVGDIELLPRVLDAASRFQVRPGEADMERLLEERHMTPLFVEIYTRTSVLAHISALVYRITRYCYIRFTKPPGLAWTVLLRSPQQRQA